MGAWDATSFGNDTANDWAYGLEDCGDLSLIDDTLQMLLDAGEDFIDSSEAEESIAAAEVLAWLRGRPTPVDSYTEKVAEWVAAHPLVPPPALIRKALDALDRIQRDPSELLDLWEGDEAWKSAMDDLRARLSD